MPSERSIAMSMARFWKPESRRPAASMPGRYSCAIEMRLDTGSDLDIAIGSERDAEQPQHEDREEEREEERVARAEVLDDLESRAPRADGDEVPAPRDPDRAGRRSGLDGGGHSPIPFAAASSGVRSADASATSAR